MKSIELVLQDHVLLHRGLDIIDSMLKLMSDGERIEIADVTDVLNFLRLFGDQYHQIMEETVLFPALLDAAPDEVGLRQLVSEHGNERALVIEIQETLLARRGMAFFRSAQHLTAMLRHHCSKEESIISNLAARGFSRETDSDVFGQFIKCRPQPGLYSRFPYLERKYVLRQRANFVTAHSAT